MTGTTGCAGRAGAWAGAGAAAATSAVDAPLEGSLDAVLDQVEHDVFALDLATAPREWLATKPLMSCCTDMK